MSILPWTSVSTAHQPHAGHALVGFHDTRVFGAPTWDVEVVSEPGSHERQTSVHCLHVVATDEFPIRSMKSLVLDAAGHCVPAIHPYGLIEYRPHRAAHVTHVVSPHLSRRVCQAIWVQGTRRVEQEPRRFNGVTGNTDDARPLPLMIALLVSIHDPRDLSGFVVFDS